MGPARRLVTIKRSGVDGPHFPLSLSTCLFGRSIECDIRIQLPVVSKQHCKIEISEQEAVLFNFSSTNPTQINGSTFDKPVPLKHGDVITIVDRSFRYENESHQDGSKSPGFPGQRRDQEASRRISRSSLSSNPEGKAQDSSAHSEVTEEAVSGKPVAHGEDVTAAHAVSGRREDHVSRKTPSRVRSSELPGDTCRGATDPTTRDLKEDPSVASGTCREEPKALSSIQCLKRSDQSESPFRKLYESMKVELDVNPGNGNVLQNRRKSGLQHHCPAGRESADGLQDETLLSPKSRRKSGRSPHMKADPGLGEQGNSQTEGDRSGELVQMPKEPKSPGIALTEMQTRKTRTPMRCSQQTTMPLRCSPHSPSQRRRSEDLSVGGGRVSQSLDQSEGSRADDQMFTPQKFLPGNQTPVKIGSFENTPEKLFSRKRKRVPANVDRLTAETEIPPPTISAPLALKVERKIQSDLLNNSEKLGLATGQVGPGLSGLGAADVSSFGDSTNKMEGMAAKRRRVSFGGCLRPELFDENLPPNTPLKRGETPKQRRSLVAHTPTVLKKIIKEQPQPSGKEDSSEVRLKVTSPDAFMSSPAANAIHASAATPDRCRRLSKASCVSGVSRSPHQTDVPRKGGRRSGSLPPQRASLERNQHGILQTIFSRRRSGASEANLIVARSWADVVKLGAKQAQNKAVKRGLPKQPGRRQRRANTPKKPPGPVHSQFSTGHANSPCTIVIGKAQLEKVTAPARPYRVINNFLVSKPRDFSEDLSGLPEMFKTPVKEKLQRMSMCPPTFPNSEDLLGKELPGPHSGEKPLLCTLENFGEDVFPRTQDTAKGPSDQSSANPALRRPSIKMNKDPVKTPRSTNETIAAEMKTPVSTTATPKATSSANRSRRSAELSGVQTPGTGPENQDAKPDTVEDILGRRLRKTPQPELKLERDTKESEKSFEQCKQNIKSKENSEKTIAVRRSRRASELKCEPAADLTTLQRSQDTEPEEKQVDILSLLQTPVHAKEVTDAKNKATRMSCKSPKPGAVSTPTSMSTQLKTPSQKVGVGSFSDLRKLSETLGKAAPTQREPRDAKSIQLFKETSKQKLDPAENSAGSKRRPTTPKGKAPPLEDLAGFKELFQTPHQAKGPMTDDKTTKTPCTSPQSEPVNTPSRRGRLRTPSQKVNVQEDLSALRKPQQTPGKTTRSPREPEGGDKGIAVSQEAPEEMLDLTEKVPSAKRRPRTPKGKAQPLEDLTGFKELFQTPDQTREPMTDAKTTKTPCKSSQPEPVNIPSRRGRLRTPSQKVDVEEELSSLRKPQQTPRGTGQSDREPTDGDEDIKVSKEMPRQKMDPSDYVTGIKRQSRTPKEDVQSLKDLTGFRELFQTPTHTKLPRAIVKTPQMLGQSPQLKPVNMTPTRRGRLRTPSQKMDMQEDLSALRKPQQTPGETTQSSREPEAGDRSIAVSQEAPEEMLDLAEKVPATKRRSRTPKGKTPLLEDLAGFKELFQTPLQAKETMTDEKPTTIPSKSPPAEPVNMPTSKKRRLKSSPREVGIEEELSVLRRPAQAPGGTRHSEGEAAGDGEDIKAFMETPRQKLDPAENVTGIKRQLRTPKEKVQSLENLTGFRELFQTPDHTKEPKAVLNTPQMLCTSSQSELIVTPTNRKRQPRTLLGKVDTEKELSVLRRHTPASGQTMHTWCREPGDDDQSTESFEETPKQKLGPAENSAGSRRPTTPKGKAPPLEDLAGFKELFQTPHQAKGPMTDDKTTKTPCTSPQSEPVNTPSRRGRLRTPSQKVNVQEDLSALRKPQQTPGKTARSPREPEGGDKGIAVSQEAPEEMLDLTEKVPSAKRRPRTPKGKAQPLEDLTGFKELFQTPDQAREPMTDAKTTKTPCTSPQPEPVNTPSRTPSQKVNVLEGLSALRKPQQTPGKTTQSPREPEGGDKGIAVSQEAPEEMLDLTEKVPSAKRRPRTPKGKAQPLEDLTGFKELLQTPDQAREPMTDAKTTKTFYKSPAETVNMPTSKKRQLKSPPQEVDIEEELSVLRRPAQTPGGTRHSGEAAGDFEDIKAFTGMPRQKLDPAENMTGIKRQLRTPKEKVQSLEDLTGFRELFQTPDHTKEPRAVLKTPKMLCQSPPLEPVNVTPGRRGSLRTPSQKVDMQEDRSALRKPTHTPGMTTHSPKEPEGGDRGAAVSRETPEEKPDPAENLTASKRRPRTPQEKAQLLEDLDGFKELFQTPDHADGAMTDDKLTTMPCTSPPAEAFNTPTSEKRRLKSSPQKVDVKEELSALRRSAQTPRGTRHSEGEAAGDGEDIKAFMETPRQKLDPAENVTGIKRQLRTPKEKVQSLENLTGFRELFQTPDHTKEPKAVLNTPQMLCTSSQSELIVTPTNRKRQPRTLLGKVDTEKELSVLRRHTPASGQTMHTWCREPGDDDQSTESFEETPKQKLGPAENSAGSRRPTTPKGKAPPLEDLAGFKELFQTPHQAKGPMTDDKTTKTPCTSPQSEPVNTPSRRGRLRTPSQKVNVQEDLSALRKPQQTPGKTARSPREPEGGDKGIAVSQEAPEEMLDLTEKVPSAKRRPRTPKGKAQPLEDLTGFKELFQTPDQAREPMTDAKTTKTPCTSPQPEPVNTPSRTPSQKVNVLEGLSALRKPQQTPGKTTQSPREPEGGDKGIAVSQEAPEEMLDLTEKVPSAKRRPRTPKGKAQPLEDLTGFKELLQTPDQAREPMTDAKTTKTFYKSPAETVNMPTSKKRQLKSPPQEVDIEEELSVLRRPAQTPGGTRHSGEAAGDFEDIKAFTGMPRQKLDPAENMTGIKRQLRTPKEKVQSLEDLTGFRELFQTPDHTKEPRAVLKTPKMLCQSPPLEPVNVTPGRRGSLRTPSQKVDMQEDRSALRKPTHTPGMTTHSPKEPEGGDRGAAVSRETPEEKPDPAENLTASKRRPRTPQEKAQLLEDLDGFKELFQTPDHADGAMTDDKLTTMPCTSPPAEAFNTPTSEKRRLKSSPQKVDVKEELSALRRSAQTPRGTRHSEGEPAGDGEEKAFTKTPKQKLDSAESLTGSKRRPRASLKEKAQPLEDLTGFKELFQAPRQSKEPMTENSIPQMLCQSPQPEPVTITPARRGHLRTPSKTVDRQEDCSALRKPQQTPGEATHSPREPEGGDRGTAVSREAPEEKLDSAENITARKRWPRIPKEKAQPLEDLSGFKELFQTPDHAKQPIMIDDHPLAIPYKSPAERVTRRTSRKKQLRSSPEKVGVEEPSALRRPSQTPEEATRMQREAEKDEKDIKVCKKTSRQKLVSAENVTGVKSRRRNIKEQAQPTEDPARVKEPFQNPNQTEEPASDVKIAPASCQSPPAQPVIRRMTRQRRLRSPPGKVAVEEPSASTGPIQTPGDTHTEPVGKEKDSKVLKETSGQKLSPAENVTGIRSRLRTLKKKTQPLEDSASVKELFQKPDQAKEADSDVTIAPGPRPSPPAEPVTRPTSRKRRPKSSPEKVDKEEPTPTPGESTWGQPAPDEKDSRVLKENPRQKLNPAENVTGVRSRLRTLKEKTQPLEDPASVKELFQDPDQVKEPEGDVTTIPMPRQSPPAKPITRPTSRKRRLKASPEKVDIERPSALREPTQTPGETTHSEPVRDEKDNRVLKENSKQKLNPAENVIGVRSRLRTLKEKTQPLKDLAGAKELCQKQDWAKEPVSDGTTAPAPHQSPPAQPVTRRTARQKQLRSPPRKVAVDKPSALSRPAQTPEETTHTEPVGNENKIKMAKETSRRNLNSAENFIGVRSRRKAFQEKTVEDPASSQEPFQKPDQAEELESSSTAIKRASKQTADRRPVETSRRVLRAPKVRFTEDLEGSREPAKHPGESCVSLSPEREQGEDGRVTGRKRLRPVTAAQDPEDERPLQKKQRTAPRETWEPPEPPGVKKRSLRTLAQRTEPVGNLPDDDLKAKATDPQEVAQAPNKGVSLRSRRPAKTSVEEQRPEVLISEEKVKINRSKKKSVQPSQEMKLQSPEDGAKKPASGSKVEERRTRSRPGRQNQTPLPEAAEEKAREGRVDIPAKKQEEKEGTGLSDPKGSRSRKVSVRPRGNPSETASEQRVTRSAKRCAHSLQKESENVCVKKIRTRNRRDPEDI